MTDTPEKILYTATASAQGGRRQGSSRTDDAQVDVTIAAPTELGGDGEGTNPEQLFAVGYGACFNGALALVAKGEGIDASAATTHVEVGFGPEGSGFAITVDLTSTIPDVDDATAQKLVEAAHQVCPYSKATRGNVPVTVTGKAG